MKSSKLIDCDEILASFSFWLDCSNIGKVHRPRIGKYGSKISFGIIICQGTKSDHCFAFSVPRSINQSLPFVNFRLFFQEHKYPGVEMGDTRKRANGVNAEISSFFVGTPRAKFIYYIAHPCSGQHPSQGWVPCGHGQGAIASASRPAAISLM